MERAQSEQEVFLEQTVYTIAVQGRLGVQLCCPSSMLDLAVLWISAAIAGSLRGHVINTGCMRALWQDLAVLCMAMGCHFIYNNGGRGRFSWQRVGNRSPKAVWAVTSNQAHPR